MPRPLPRPNACPDCYSSVVTVRGVQSNNGNPAVFSLAPMQGYDNVHITVFTDAAASTPNLGPVFSSFHVTWEYTDQNVRRKAHYHFDEIQAGRWIAYEESMPSPVTDPGWTFRNPQDIDLLRNTSVNLARELADEINHKYRPTDQC